MIEYKPSSLLNMEKLSKKFGTLGKKATAAASEAVGKYLLNILVHKEIPPYRHVSRKQAYPEVDGWFSDKQRAWFFANKSRFISPSGSIIPYRRRGPGGGGIQSKWQMVGSGMNLVVSNLAPEANHIYDDFGQSRMANLGGWLTVGKIIVKYAKNTLASATRAIQKLIKDEGLE